MGRPAWVYNECKRCSAKRTPELHISKRGLCTDCATAAQTKNILALHRKEGENWENYKRRWIEGTAATQERYLGDSG